MFFTKFIAPRSEWLQLSTDQARRQGNMIKADWCFGGADVPFDLIDRYNPRYPVADRYIRFFQTLYRHPEGLTPTELALISGQPVASVSGMISSQRAVLERTDPEGTFTLRRPRCL